MTLRHEIEITLQVPVQVDGADGKPALRQKITLRRPNTGHVKRIAAIFGPDLLALLTGSELEGEIDKVGMARKVGDVLLRQDRLDELGAILAGMCGETPDFVDRLDLLDLWEVGLKLADFFPVLQSFAPSKLLPT